MTTGYEFARDDELNYDEHSHRFNIIRNKDAGLSAKRARHSLLLVLLERQRRRNGGKRWDMI